MIRFSPNPNRANLINWHEWGEEAFRAAREQNKPVMLFLSAFWCRYCQRMDEEAFSETENIAVLRAYFIPIRAENAQRPDLDIRYNQNGWPTIVFMSPGGEPIVAANYLPSDRFQDLLLRVYMGHQQNQESPRHPEPGEGRDDQPAAASPGRTKLSESSVMEIAGAIMDSADGIHGGYGNGQKFIQPEPNDFLLSFYKRTRNADYLNHVCLTLDRMEEGAIRDHAAGGFFRTSTGPDWDQPHREKLLAEQAGLILNCLRAFRLTQRPVYARMAEGIIGYLDAKLLEDPTGAFYGCEDFLRVDETDPTRRDEFFTIIDRCIYTDANAPAIVAYLEAAAVLNRPECRERALRAVDFLWQHCRYADGSMCHYYNDGMPHLAGWLNDQTSMGTALLRAYEATGKIAYLDRARQLGEFVPTNYTNPEGGYYDCAAPGLAHLSVRLTLIEQNGLAASFFLALASATEDRRWREAALWALGAFKEDLRSYGVYAASFGRALVDYFNDNGGGLAGGAK